MPVTARISDAELRQRLEEHSYNVPPITDTTRAILIKKLTQLDQQRQKQLVGDRQKQGVAGRKQGAVYTALDYSSAEDEDFPPPQANSTRRSIVGGRMPNTQTTARNRNTRGNRQFSRGGTPVGQAGQSQGVAQNNRRNVSLMTHSEEEGSDEEEEDDEEEEICGDGDEEDEDSEEENDMGNGVDNVDLSESPGILSFRGQRFTSTPSSSPEYHRSNGGGGAFAGGRFASSGSTSTSPTYSIMSPHLRKNLNSFGSLNEALSTLPGGPKPGRSSPGYSVTTSPSTLVTQVNTSRHNTSSFREEDKRTCNSMLISSLIIVSAVLFFLFIAYQYVTLKPGEQAHRIPLCRPDVPEDIPRVTCVPKDQLNSTASLYGHVVKLLQEHSQEQLCVRGSTDLGMGLEQVEQHLSHVSGMTGPQLEEHLQNLLLLLRENPGWGISLLPTNDEAVSQLVVKEPVISWYCWLGLQLANLFSLAVKLAGYLACLMLVGAVVWLAVWLWGKMTERSERQRQEVFDLVERVLSILFHQHQAVIREGKQGPTYLAIDHIRDQLIPPADRRSKAAVWEKVVQYIRNQESRVRDDVQTIFGEEFRVWQWLPDIPWSPRVSASPSSPSSPRGSHQNTASPPALSSPPSPPDQWSPAPTTVVTPGWQGSAFQLGKHVAAPLAPPTPCLKVRHMFDPKSLSPGWVLAIKEEILRRCSNSSILHIAVDTESVEGTVYIKTSSPDDAGRVFRALHGQWYRGQLVTAKYLRLERYHERFPDSRNVRSALKCSK